MAERGHRPLDIVADYFRVGKYRFLPHCVSSRVVPQTPKDKRLNSTGFPNKTRPSANHMKVELDSNTWR